jgi:hypothetical protein
MESVILNTSRSEVDAFTAEVIRSAVVAITGEMKTNLMRTAYHTIIYEAEDFTVGLFDADGNTSHRSWSADVYRGLSMRSRRRLRTGARQYSSRRYFAHQLHHGPSDHYDLHAAIFNDGERWRSRRRWRIGRISADSWAA